MMAQQPQPPRRLMAISLVGLVKKIFLISVISSHFAQRLLIQLEPDVEARRMQIRH